MHWSGKYSFIWNYCCTVLHNSVCMSGCNVELATRKWTPEKNGSLIVEEILFFVHFHIFIAGTLLCLLIVVLTEIDSRHRGKNRGWWRNIFLLHPVGGQLGDIIAFDYCGHIPDSKVHEANMGPIWRRQDPGGPHVGPMNLAIWVIFTLLFVQ